MKTAFKIIDINENILRHKGEILNILLIDRTSSSGKKKVNIIWATDSYLAYGKNYLPKKKIKIEQVTGPYNKIIQPRVSKSKHCLLYTSPSPRD